MQLDGELCCRFERENKTVAVEVHLRLEHAEPTEITIGHAVVGGVYTYGTYLYVPWKPIEFHLDTQVFERGDEVALVVADVGSRPEAIDWRSMPWVWQQAYRASLKGSQPRLDPINRS